MLASAVTVLICLSVLIVPLLLFSQRYTGDGDSKVLSAGWPARWISQNQTASDPPPGHTMKFSSPAEYPLHVQWVGLLANVSATLGFLFVLTILVLLWRKKRSSAITTTEGQG